jgi:hypothetical protein
METRGDVFLKSLIPVNSPAVGVWREQVTKIPVFRPLVYLLPHRRVHRGETRAGISIDGENRVHCCHLEQSGYPFIDTA